MVQLYQAEVVVFDQALSPAQQRNLEKHLGVAVADRTMLILEIFGERARSHEGKLQVELARLQYLSTRLVRRWSHLERQRGGIGTRGGPGETQIELDRRMIGERIKRIKKQLEKVKQQRSTQRRRARAQRRPSASRSSATPTPASRRSSTRWSRPRPMPPTSCSPPSTPPRASCYLEQLERGVALSDTVGFIRDLPHSLIEAFQATLAGGGRCRPAAARGRRLQSRPAEQIDEVERVLEEIGAGEVPQVARLQQDRSARRERAAARPATVSSCPPGGGCPALFVSGRHRRGPGRCASARRWR